LGTQDISTKNEGLRERKKRETLQRIAETGLKLFIAQGYEGTTLEAIAEAAGISRRTFFYYFKSKKRCCWRGKGAGFSMPPARHA
jgi:AcrR family transcriptional regulator